MFQLFFQWEKFTTPQFVKNILLSDVGWRCHRRHHWRFSSFAMTRYFGLCMEIMYFIGAIHEVFIGCIFTRIVAELIMVTFSINDDLKAIKENGRR